MKYRKKPVVIEAEELTYDKAIQHKIIKWIVEGGHDARMGHDGGIIIKTLEGDMLANTGSFIIKGVEGEFYACDPNIFKKTYELAGE
jgi:hypothetical protein